MTTLNQQLSAEKTPVILPSIQSEIVTATISPLTLKNSLAVSDYINNPATTPANDQYAPYYTAMLAKFNSHASVVAMNANNEVVGVALGIYHPQTKSVHVTHFNAASGFSDLEDEMLEKLRQQAATEYHAESIITETALSSIGQSASDSFITVSSPFQMDYISPRKNTITLRHPTKDDAQAMLDVVLETNKESSQGGLDIYALKSYQRMCDTFAETSLVATIDDKVVGFMTGFLMPNTPEPELFVWQVGVDPKDQGNGIGPMLLRTIVEQASIKSFVTTIEGDNKPSQNAFAKLARKMGINFSHTGEEIPTEVLTPVGAQHQHDPELIFAGRPAPA